MALITFRCPSCKLVLKIAAEKAGRKAKCRCGAELTIPLVSEDLPAVAKAAAAPRSAAMEEDEETVSGYGLAAVPEPVEEQKPKEQPKELKAATTPRDEEELERKRRRRAALRKAPMDPVRWERVRVGILLVLVATYLWVGAIVLQLVLLGIGMANGPGYAAAADIPVLIPPQPDLPLGEELDLDKTSFVVALLAGMESMDTGFWLMRIGQVFVLLQGLAAIAGCAICLSVPPRFGTYGMVLAALSIAVLNLILQLVFKLLPLTGPMYIMIPLVTPELTMTTANVGRLLPLHVYWSDAPFWEIFAALLIQMLFYAPPVLFSLFLRGAGLSLRDEKLPGLANGIIVLALGTAFALVAYYLLSLTGTSEVMGWVMRAVYGLWVAFLLGELLWYAHVLHQSREIIAAKLAEEE